MMTKPFLTVGLGRNMTPGELARAIRQDIIAENDAVALYEAHIEATDDKAVQAVLQHIVDEEKMHIAELTTLLGYLDNNQKLINSKGKNHAKALIAGGRVEENFTVSEPISGEVAEGFSYVDD